PDDSSDGDDSDESYRADGDATNSDAASSTTTRNRNRYTRRWRESAYSSASCRVRIAEPGRGSEEPLSRIGRKQVAYERINLIIDRSLEDKLVLPEGVRPAKLKLPDLVKFLGKSNIDMFDRWL